MQSFFNVFRSLVADDSDSSENGDNISVEDNADDDYEDKDYEDDDDEHVDDLRSNVRVKRHVVEKEAVYMEGMAKTTEDEAESLLTIDHHSRHKIRHLKEKVGRLGRHSQLVKAVLGAYCLPQRIYTTQFVNCSDQQQQLHHDDGSDAAGYATRTASLESLSVAHPVMLLMGSKMGPRGGDNRETKMDRNAGIQYIY